MMHLRPSILKAALDRRFLGFALRRSNLSTKAYDVIPRVAKPAFWQSLIPKPLRSSSQPTGGVPARKATQQKPWNPATFFIIIFLLIGSNSINLLAVKNEYLSFSRQADAKIAALKEAIEKVQRGEDVDVKRLLGTGDSTAEQEWEEVLKELKQERPPANRKNQEMTAAADKSHADSTRFASLETADDWTKPREDGQKPRKVDFY